MAIQIWDPATNTYRSADLSRFGPSGTLKEALVWDGSKYVKVWPSAAPSPYPLSATWGPTSITNTGNYVTVASHVMESSGDFKVSFSATGAANFYRAVNRNGEQLTIGPGVDIADFPFSATSGDVIDMQVIVFAASTVSGSWTIAPA